MFIRTLSAMPEKQALLVGVASTFVAAGICNTYFSSGFKRPSTMNAEWAAATKAYMKAQNNNPISGISKQ